MYKHPQNVSRRFQKHISSRTKDIKQFSQLMTHEHTHTHTSVNLELTQPELGGSAKKWVASRKKQVVSEEKRVASKEKQVACQ